MNKKYSHLSVMLFILLSFFQVQSTWAQDMVKFTFHTDASSGNGAVGDVTGLSLLGLTISGSADADRVLSFEIADAIGTFSPVTCVNVDSLSQGDTAQAAGGFPQRWQCPVGGFTKFRSRISGGSAGTVNVVGFGLSRVSVSSIASASSAGGGGNVISNLASTINGRLTTFSGTTGTIITDFSGTGMLKVNNGVPQIATSLDFQPPLGFTPVPDTRTINGIPLSSNVNIDKISVGLGNVTNDAQLKRSANDFSSFTSKPTPIGADVLLIEDSAAGGAKKSILMSSLSTGSGITDGNKGDITVSGSGTSWVINPSAVSYGKIQNVGASQRILGRITAGTGIIEELTGAQVKTILSINFTDISGIATDLQIDNLNLYSTGLAPNSCVQTDATGKLGVAAGLCGVSGGTTGIAGASNHGILVATGSTTATSLAEASNGQIPIGSSGANPVLATLQSNPAQIRITNAPGSITIDLPPGGVTLPGTTVGTLSGNATTATALAANGANCAIAGTFPNGVDASGAAENCTPLIADPGSNGLVNRVGTTTSSAITSSTVGLVLRVTGANTFAFGALDLSNPSAIVNRLPYGNLVAASAASLLLGRGAGSGAGDWQEVTLGSHLALSGTTLNTVGDVPTTTTINTATPLTGGGTLSGPLSLGCPTCVTTPSTLTLGLPVIGGGGVATSVGTKSGTTSEFGTTSGAKTAGVQLTYDATANIVVSSILVGDVSPGDKGDITVASGVWTIDPQAVTYAKIQNVSTTQRILGRNTAGAGIIEELSPTTVKTMLAITFADITGPALTDAQIPDLNTLSTTLTPLRCVETAADGKLSVAAGACGTSTGGGISGASLHGILIATGAATGTSLAVATNGQIPIGSTGADPVLGTITGTPNQIQVTVGPGTITVAIPSNPTLPGTTSGSFSGPLAGNASTATALFANGANCPAGNAPLGVDALGAVEGCFDVATQAELDAFVALTTVHGSTSLNTPSRIVQRDASGNFAAGTITATLAGNASTATALAANGTNCPGGQASAGVDASGNAEGCFTPASGNISGATVNGVLYATAANAATSTPALTNGQLIIGSTGSVPVPALPTGTANQITVTPGPGTLTFAIANSPTLPGTTTGSFSGPLNGNATTATALAANGANCLVAGTFPNGVDASGAAENCVTLSARNAQSTTYSAIASDFDSYKTITVASGTFTITLVANTSQPGNGKYIRVINYGTGTVTIARNGQNLNDGTSNILLPPGSATSPTSAFVMSDGVNYYVATANSKGHTLQEEGASLPPEPFLNMIGRRSTCADNSGTSSTNCTFTDVLSAPFGDVATIGINADITDVASVTLGASTQTSYTFSNPLGTPQDNQLLLIRITTNVGAPPKPITWGSAFTESAGTPRPVTTSGNAIDDYFAFRRNNTLGTWVMVATTQGSLTARRRTCVIPIERGGSALVDSDIAIKRRCTIPTNASIEEISVIADSSGTPAVSPHRTPAAFTATALLTTPLATNAAGALACARVAAGNGFSGVACSGTLINTATTGEVFLGLTSGTASTNTTDILVTIHYLLNS